MGSFCALTVCVLGVLALILCHYRVLIIHFILCRRSFEVIMLVISIVEVKSYTLFDIETMLKVFCIYMCMTQSYTGRFFLFVI